MRQHLLEPVSDRGWLVRWTMVVVVLLKGGVVIVVVAAAVFVVAQGDFWME